RPGTRGTTWHDSPLRLRVLQGLPVLRANSGEKLGFGETGCASVQSSVQWPWSQRGTTWHNRIDGMTGQGARGTRSCAYHVGPRVPGPSAARAPGAPQGQGWATPLAVAVPADVAAMAGRSSAPCHPSLPSVSQPRASAHSRLSSRATPAAVQVEHPVAVT